MLLVRKGVNYALEARSDLLFSIKVARWDSNRRGNMTAQLPY